MANGTTTPAAPSFASQNQGAASVGDVSTQLKGITAQLSSNGALLQQLVNTILAAFPRIIGTFTMPAANTVVIPNTGVKANSYIGVPTPTNAAAATLMQSTKSLFLASISPGVSFTFSTADGTNAAGTETFQYALTNPV